MKAKIKRRSNLRNREKTGNYFPALRFPILFFGFLALFGFFGGEASEVFESWAGGFFFGGVGGDLLFLELGLRSGVFGDEFKVRFLSGASGGGGIIVSETGVAGGEINFIFDSRLATGIGEFFFPLFGGFDGFFDFSFDGFARARVNHAGVTNNLGAEIAGRLRDTEGGGGESGGFFAVDNHGDDKVAIVHIK